MARRRTRTRPILLTLEARENPAVIAGLDLTFDADGKATTDFGFDDRGQAVVVQDDGKIVVAGFDDGGAADFAIARYNRDGTLDTTFNDIATPTGENGDGRVSFTFGAPVFGGEEKAHAVAIDSVGRIVVAGYTDATGAGANDFAVARLNPNGTLDATFGTGGKTTIDFGFDDRATAVAIVAGDKIVVAGFDDGGLADFALARLNVNGTLDTTFNDIVAPTGENGDGRLSFTFGAPVFGGVEKAHGLAVQPDGRLVVVGATDAGGGVGANNFAVARVNENGTLDATFGAGGKATFDFGFDDQATAVAVQGDGKIVVVGFDDGGSADFALVRLNTNGALDTTFNDVVAPTTFNGDGRLSFTFGAGAFGGVEKAHAVAIQDDGKIVVAGATDAGGSTNFGVARVNADGTQDAAFDGDGEAIYDFGGADEARGVAVQSDDRLVVAGFTGAGDFAVARVNATVGATDDLLVGGSPDGKAIEFVTKAGGLYATAGTTVDLLPGTGKPVRVAEADVNGDGVLDRIAVTGPGTANRLTVQDGATGTVLADPFEVFPTFTGGLFVSAADMTGDGRAEVVITPDLTGGPVVAVYDGSKLAAGLTGDAAQVVRFFGINNVAFRGGARSALGDINADGTPDLIIAAGFSGGPQVAVYSGKAIIANAAVLAASGFANTPTFQLVTDFFAFEDTVRNGVFVAAGDVNGDGFDDLVFGGGPTAGPRVRVASGKLLLGVVGLTSLDVAVPATPALQVANFFAGSSATRGGVPVAVKDVDADGKADIVAASGEGLPSRVLVYRSATAVAAVGEAAADQTLDPFGATLAAGVYVG